MKDNSIDHIKVFGKPVPHNGMKFQLNDGEWVSSESALVLSCPKLPSIRENDSPESFSPSTTQHLLSGSSFIIGTRPNIETVMNEAASVLRGNQERDDGKCRVPPLTLRPKLLQTRSHPISIDWSAIPPDYFATISEPAKKRDVEFKNVPLGLYMPELSPYKLTRVSTMTFDPQNTRICKWERFGSSSLESFTEMFETNMGSSKLRPRFQPMQINSLPQHISRRRTIRRPPSLDQTPPSTPPRSPTVPPALLRRQSSTLSSCSLDSIDLDMLRSLVMDDDACGPPKLHRLFPFRSSRSVPDVLDDDFTPIADF